MARPSNGIEWQDTKGRLFLVQLLDKEDSDLSHGAIIGPPLELWERLDDLPEPLRLRLHNELYYRGLFSEEDIRLSPGDVDGALKAALGIYGRRVAEAYSG